MRVYDAKGDYVGRVADLRAEAIDEQLRVTGLVVGDAQLLARIGVGIVELVGRGALPGYYVPWSMVSRLDREIHLNVGKDRLEKQRDAVHVSYSG